MERIATDNGIEKAFENVWKRLDSLEMKVHKMSNEHNEGDETPARKLVYDKTKRTIVEIDDQQHAG